MAQGSTGFSKEEIDALMFVLDRSDFSGTGSAMMRAYRKLVGVQRRLS
jgi:hypothetical protein